MSALPGRREAPKVVSEKPGWKLLSKEMPRNGEVPEVQDFQMGCYLIMSYTAPWPVCQVYRDISIKNSLLHCFTAISGGQFQKCDIGKQAAYLLLYANPYRMHIT